MENSLARLTLPFFPIPAPEQVSHGFFSIWTSCSRHHEKICQGFSRSLHEKHASFKAEPFSAGLRKALEVLESGSPEILFGDAVLAHLTSKPTRQFFPPCPRVPVFHPSDEVKVSSCLLYILCIGRVGKWPKIPNKECFKMFLDAFDQCFSTLATLGTADFNSQNTPARRRRGITTLYFFL